MYPPALRQAQGGPEPSRGTGADTPARAGATAGPYDALLLDVLHRVWGFSDFRPLQRDAMHAALDARDSLVVLPTGGGKSLCFQAPAIASNQLAIVVSPLISLMKDQVDGLRVDGVAASYLNSTLLPGQRDEVLASIRDERCRLLYVSPERIVADGALRRLLQQTGIRFIAIDEAHCISQWGHDFRPEYRQLGALRDEFPGVSVHAFTATATERVRRDIASELRLRDPLVLVGSFDRPNLIYRVLRRGDFHKQLGDVLARHEHEAGIVYCSSRREVESIAAKLQAEGHRAAPYHAGLPDEVRSRHQEAFLDDQIDAVPDSVVLAQKIVSCVVRVKQTRGSSHVTDVLLGRATEKVAAAGHDSLSTFGLLRDESAAAIRGYIEQLVVAGFLSREGEPYPVLRLTATGTTLLRGGAACVLYREVRPPSARARSRSSIRDTFVSRIDSDLFDVLRGVRLRLAQARGVPPYVIFHDTTLREMAMRRPKTVDDLRSVYGVGAKKAADFGDAFLDAIRTFHKPD